MRQIRIKNDFESWREAAREVLAANVSPQDVVFVEGGLEHALLPGLFSGPACGARPVDDRRTEPRRASEAAKRVPREFVTLAKNVACHRDPARWSLRSEEHTSELQSRLHLVCRL